MLDGTFNMINFIEKTFIVSCNRNLEPPWSKRLDRWFQLDEESFALCNALECWLNIPGVCPNPSTILHSSPQGSWQSDIDFVRSGAESPAKFVYTLPSIPMGILAQFLSYNNHPWRGSMFNFTGKNSWEQLELFSECHLSNQNQFKLKEQDPTPKNQLHQTSSCASDKFELTSHSNATWLVCINRIDDDFDLREVRWKQIY